VKLFGPVLPYDLIRQARRGRFILLRCLYILLLLGIMYMMWEGGRLGSRATVTLQDLAEFAERFFNTYLLVQFLAVLLLTPAYVAGAVADEKQRRTLEYLLATDLRNREVILGKLASRLLNLSLFLLAGLPVLSVIQLFGGVDADLLWSGFAATALTMASVASVSILISVHVSRPRDAIILTYMLVIAYFALWGMLALVQYGLIVQFFPGGWADEVGDWVLTVYNAGNVFYAMYRLEEAGRATGNYGGVMLDLLLRYAAFHGVVALVATALAVARLRAVFVRQAFGAARRPAARKARERRPVGRFPMVWKECVVEGGFRIGWFGKVLFTFLALAALTPAAFILTFGLFRRGISSQGLSAELLLTVGCVLGGLLVFGTVAAAAWYSRGLRRAALILVGLASLAPGAFLTTVWLESGPGVHAVANEMLVYIQIMTVVLGSIALLGVAVRAGGSIGAEKDRQTYVSLLSSPLTNVEILAAKWLGSVLAVRWVFGLLLVIWLIGLPTGGLHPLALPVLAVIFAVYLSFAASLGMLFAAATKTTLRGIMWSVGTLVFVGGGHWFCTGCCLTALGVGAALDSREVMSFFLALTPPVVMTAGAFNQESLLYTHARPIEEPAMVLVGLLAFAAGAVVLWFLAVLQFDHSSGRIRERAAGPTPPGRGHSAPARTG
jgi:ABC-type transport system involved in multi-copper enzyme maturation permease subunit